MAKIDLFVSKSPLGQGASPMPYQGISNFNLSGAQAAAPLQTLATGLDNIRSVYQAKRDLEVRTAVAGYTDKIKDNIWREAATAQAHNAPLHDVYEEVEAFGKTARVLMAQNGHTAYQNNTAAFQQNLLSQIDDSKVRKLVAASIPTTVRAKNYEVEKHYELLKVDFLKAQRLHQIDARGDRLADALSQDPTYWTDADRTQLREDWARSLTMYRAMADDGLTKWADVPKLEETFGNKLAEDVFEGMIQRARSAGATVVEGEDGLETVTTPELDRLLIVLDSDKNVQRHARELSEILGLPEDMVLDLETEKRIALLNDVHTKIEQVSDEYREELKFQWRLEERAQTERHAENRRTTIELFGSTEVLSDPQRQEWIAKFSEKHGFIPSGPNGTLTVDDVIILEAADAISPEWADTLRGWIAQGFEGDQDWATFIDFKKQIANADVNDLAGIQENVFKKARSLGTPWVSQLVGDITSRRTKTPDSEAHARAENLLIRKFGGALDVGNSGRDWTAKTGAILGSALDRFSDQTRDDDGILIGGLDYQAIAGGIFDQLIGIDDAAEALENKIRPVVANMTFNNLARDAWGDQFLDATAGDEIINQSRKTLDILTMLQAGASPGDFTKEELKNAGLANLVITKMITADTTVDQLKRLMGVSPSMFTTASSIQAARDDLDRMISIRSRHLRRSAE